MADVEFPLNTDLPPYYRSPGVFTQVIESDPGAPAPLNRALVCGYLKSGGLATPGSPFLASGADLVDQMVKRDSMAAKGYRAAKAALKNGVGAEIWVLPLVEPSAGAKATHLIKFLAPAAADGVLGAGTAALVTHSCTIEIGSSSSSFRIDQGDTFAQVGAKALAALQSDLNLDVDVGANGAELTVTDKHKGEHGAELPIRVNFSVPSSVGGVAASPGTATLAAGPAAPGGTLTLASHVRRVTPTLVGAGVATAIGANNNRVSYTANQAGVTIARVVAGNNTALTVTVNAKAISVNEATDGGGVATTTGSQELAQVLLTPAAMALLSAAALTSGSDGTAATTAVGATALPFTVSDASAAVQLRDAINADPFPATAAVASPATGVVTLFYRPDRSLYKLAASGANLGGQTITGAFGTAGSGVPDIAGALAILAADKSLVFRAWSVFWTDAATWGTLITWMEGQAASPIEKGQTAHACITIPLPAVLGDSLTELTSPKMGTSPRCAIDWHQGCAVRPWEIAARTAALVAAKAVNQNLNGEPLLAGTDARLPLPHRADRPSPEQVETAISTFRYAPICVDEENRVAIFRSTTTFLAAGDVQRKLEKWSCIQILDYFRASLRSRLGKTFGQSNVKRYGKPRTTRTTSPTQVQAAVFRLFKEWDLLDLYDGADDMRDAIVAGVKTSPNRIDVAAPFRTVADLDQISIVGIQQ